MHGTVRLPLWSLPLLVATVLGSVMFALLAGRTRGSLPEPELEMLRLVHSRVMSDHVEAQDARRLLERAAAGMVSGLDRYSRFIPAAEVEAFERVTTGSYEGIGIQMAPGSMPPAVLFPHPDGPAERAGLQVGDRILAVDGHPLEGDDAGHGLAEARRLILGHAGTRVRLQIGRGGQPPFEVECERGPVQTASTRWTRVVDERDGIGYVQLHAFQRVSTTELDQELAHLRAVTPGELRALILDLRGNSGGLLDQGIGIANRFLARGNIVTLKERGGRSTPHEADPAQCRDPELPLVLLVDGDSASASEVVAAALQDHQRARVVGTRTYGKGMVQTIFRWRGLDFRLKLTTSHYFTPNGRSLEGTRPGNGGPQTGGVQPDRVVELSREAAERVRTVLQENTPYVPRRYQAAAHALATELELVLPEPPGPEGDEQLAAAIEECRALIGAGNGKR